MNIPEKLGIPEYEFRLIIGSTRIEYDETKEMGNRKKHGYSLESAVHYFEQLLLPVPHPYFMTSDAFIENNEVRHMHMGLDDSDNVVIFVTTMRGKETVRIISFRRAREAECKEFNENTGYNKSSNLTGAKDAPVKLTQTLCRKRRNGMYQYFNDVVEDAETGVKSSVRALQAWQYLIGKAANRQIVQYDELSQLMGYSDNRPLGVILGCIMFYCQQQQDMPPLTLLVVNQSGVPGEGFSAEELENYHQRREDVFNFPWFTIVPPTMEEFQQARENA